MSTKIILFIVCFLMSFHHYSNAQTFKGSLILGANLSDLYAETGIDSYIGLNAGIKVSAQLKKKWAIGTELLISQQADYVTPTVFPRVAYDRILLNYIELPVQMEYRYFPTEGGYYRGVFTFGWAYARLVDFVAITKGDIDFSDEVKFKSRNTHFFHLGAGTFFNKHVGIHFRGALSTNLTWTLAFRGVYMI